MQLNLLFNIKRTLEKSTWRLTKRINNFEIKDILIANQLIVFLILTHYP